MSTGIGIGIGIGLMQNSASVPSFVPTDLADLQFWVSADEGVYSDAGTTPAANGGLVYQWNDKSGNSRHLTQATDTRRPTYNTGVINGLPAINFTSLLTAIYMQTANFTLNQPEHIFAVLRLNTYVDTARFFDGKNVFGMVMYQVAPSPGINLYAGTSSVRTTDLAVGTWAIVEVGFNGASSFIKINGGTAATGNPGAGNGGGLTLGADGSGSSGARFDVGDFLICSSIQSDSDAALVRDFLSNKYDL